MKRRARNFHVKRHRDLIWITTVFQASILEGGSSDAALLVVGTDWAKANTFDRCTLLSVRGWYNFAQTTVGTSADATGAFMAVYKTDSLAASPAFDVALASDYDKVDILYTDGLAITAVSSQAPQTTQLNIKVKRKLTVADSVRIAINLDADTAAPRVNIVGVARSLLQLDPAS